MHVRRLKSDRIRVYRSRSDRAQLLVTPVTTTSGTTSTYPSRCVRSRSVAWSSPRMYMTDVPRHGYHGEGGDGRVHADRRSISAGSSGGSTVHVGDTSDATLVRWVGAASSMPRPALSSSCGCRDMFRSSPCTELQRNATETNATVTTLVVTDASEITTGFTVLQTQITSVNVVDGTVVSTGVWTRFQKPRQNSPSAA